MTSQTLSPIHLDTLIADCKLLRILTPEMRKQIQLHQQDNQFVVEHGNQLYLSLEHIADKKQRTYFYRLIQRYQLGQKVELGVLPSEIREIIQSDRPTPALFWGPLILGGVVGLVVGVLMMAIGVLFLNVTAVSFNAASSPESFNLQIPTMLFVCFTAFSWLITSWFAWHRIKKTLADQV